MVPPRGLLLSRSVLWHRVAVAPIATRLPAAVGATRQYARQRDDSPRGKLKRKQNAGERLLKSEELQLEGKGAKYVGKVRDAELQWEDRAQKILNGQIQNTFDMLEERGFIKDLAGTKETVRELMRTRRIGAYVGIDPTASSLHIGHLVPLMPLFWLYLHGYTAVSLVGGATAKIGDPTGRLKSREAIRQADMAMNMVLMQTQLKKLWENAAAIGRTHGYEREWAWKRAVVNNNAWWNKQPMLDVLRRVGTSLRIGPMLSRDTVKTKMTKGDGVSFAEFSYPIMQGWDWYELLSQYGVQMQIGGSDQFGNIVAGIDVVKAARASDKNESTKLPADSDLDDPMGFTVPLMTDSSGQKFGKSAGNAIWLDAYKTPVFHFYGYFIRRPDEDVEQMLKRMTFLPLSRISEIMAEHLQDPSARVAQHHLALEVTTLVHGEIAAREARDQHRLMYGKAPESQASATADQYTAAPGPVTKNNAPRPDMILPKSLILGQSIARILYASGLAASVSEGHRLARAQGVYIGGMPGQHGKSMNPSQLDFTAVKLWYPQETQKYLIGDELLILRKGKHNIRIIKVVDDAEYNESGQSYPGMPRQGQIRKLKKQLADLRAGLTTAADIEKMQKEEQEQEGKADNGDYLVFPEEKDPAVKELEQKLEEELAIRREEKAAAREAADSELASELDAMDKGAATGDNFQSITGAENPKKTE